MKSLVKNILAVLLISAFASVAVFAGGTEIRKNVTFVDDVMVNGTLVKAGDYEVRFNETNGELAIMKGGKVKAKTNGHLQARSDKAKSTAIRTMSKDNVAELIGFSFGGSNQDVVVGTSGGAVTGN